MQHLHLEEKMTRSYTSLHLAAEHKLFAGGDNKCAMLEQTTAENTVSTKQQIIAPAAATNCGPVFDSSDVNMRILNETGTFDRRSSKSFSITMPRLSCTKDRPLHDRHEDQRSAELEWLDAIGLHFNDNQLSASL
jgi:hypothetical protein